MSTNRENHKESIEHELRAFEGEGPPGQSELAGSAIYELNSLLDDLDQLGETELGDYQSDIVEWIEEDALKALVAMEMHEGHR